MRAFRRSVACLPSLPVAPGTAVYRAVVSGLPRRSFYSAGAVFLFPLAIVVGVLAARRWRLAWAMAAGTALFVVAVLVAWQVQGFEPTVRDLGWLLIVLAATWVSSRYKPRN